MNRLFTSRLKLLCSLSVLAGLAACADSQPARQQLAVAESAVRHANTASTSENAAGELQIANTKLNLAREATRQENYARGQQLSEQAEVDAQVAELHAQTMRSRKAAQETQDAARALREEIARQSSR